MSRAHYRVVQVKCLLVGKVAKEEKAPKEIELVSR